MQILRLSFRGKGFVRTLPVAHTFFGAFCWGIRLFYGDTELREFLQSYKEGRLPLLFSSPLPERDGKLYFPKPACLGLNSDLKSFHEKPFMAYRLQKKLKSIAYLPEDAIIAFLEGREVKLEASYMEKMELYGERVVMAHASINRITSTTVGGELFFESAYAIPAFSVLIQVNNWPFQDGPEELLPAIFNLLPLGGNKSTGMGLFEVRLEKVPEWLGSFKEKGNFFYSLSDFLYDENQNLILQKSFYEVEVKRPAVENYFEKSGRIWKSPMLFIKAGAVMKVKRPAEYYGRLEEFSGGIYHYGYAFPIYVRGDGTCGNLSLK